MISNPSDGVENSSPPSSIEILPPANSIMDYVKPFVTTSHMKSKNPAYLQNYYCNSIGSSTIHEISYVLSYAKLSPLHISFLVAIDKFKEPKTYAEAKKLLVWDDPTDEEINVLEGT